MILEKGYTHKKGSSSYYAGNAGSVNDADQVTIM